MKMTLLGLVIATSLTLLGTQFAQARGFGGTGGGGAGGGSRGGGGAGGRGAGGGSPNGESRGGSGGGGQRDNQYSGAHGAAAGHAASNRNNPAYSGAEGAAAGHAASNRNNQQYSGTQGAAAAYAAAQNLLPPLTGAAGAIAENAAGSVNLGLPTDAGYGTFAARAGAVGGAGGAGGGSRGGGGAGGGGAGGRGAGGRGAGGRGAGGGSPNGESRGGSGGGGQRDNQYSDAQGAAARHAASNRNNPAYSGAEGAAAGAIAGNAAGSAKVGLPTDAGYGTPAARAGAVGGAAYASNHRTAAVSGSVMAARGAAVRGSYNHYDVYGRGWYGAHPGAWAAAGWGAGQAWGTTAWPATSAALGLAADALPIPYNYGSNITYQGDQVYYGDQPAATADQYYQQAATLAQSVPAPDAQNTDWLPLGVFGLVQNDQESPHYVVQFAVNKSGAIAGNHTDLVSGTNSPIHGAVNKKSQRIAWMAGDNKNTVGEMGLFNMTHDEVPVLIHMGQDKTQQWLLVRLKQPEQQNAQ